MAAKELSEWWRQKAIEDGQEISALDVLVFEAVEDSRVRGISSSALKQAADGRLRNYFKGAILSHRNTSIASVEMDFPGFGRQL
jgi:hypothetical protein